MSKQLSIDLPYDAPITEVSAMLADPAFRERVCDAQHALTRSVRIDGGQVTITSTQRVDQIPGFAARFVGDAVEIHQSESWNAGFTAGDIDISLPGKPGRLAGTATVTEGDAGSGRTVESVSLTATVSVPLVGGRLEDLVLSLFEKALTREHEVGVAWLKGE